MDETHFLSNMVPQFGPTSIAGIWPDLESTVRSLDERTWRTWIISGPLFYDPQRTIHKPPTASSPTRPLATMKCSPNPLLQNVLAKDDNGKWRSIAFVFENRRYGQPIGYLCISPQLTRIEERGGPEFFPDLGFGSSSRKRTSRGRNRRCGTESMNHRMLFPVLRGGIAVHNPSAIQRARWARLARRIDCPIGRGRPAGSSAAITSFVRI